MFSYISAALDKEENKKNYIIYSTESANIAQKLKTMLAEKTKEAIIDTFPQTVGEDLDTPLTYAAGGIVDSYVRWVRSEDGKLPLEKLVRTISDMTDYIIENVTIKKRV